MCLFKGLDCTWIHRPRIQRNVENASGFSLREQHVFIAKFLCIPACGIETGGRFAGLPLLACFGKALISNVPCTGNRGYRPDCSRVMQNCSVCRSHGNSLQARLFCRPRAIFFPDGPGRSTHAGIHADTCRLRHGCCAVRISCVCAQWVLFRRRAATRSRLPSHRHWHGRQSPHPV